MVKWQEKMRWKKQKTQIFRLIFAAWWWCWQHNSRVAVLEVGGRRTYVRPCEIWDNDVERGKNDHKQTEFPMERRGMGQTIKSDEIKRYKGENTSILCI